MVFSIEWEQCYKDNTNMSIWPWSDLVSYVMRYARPDCADFSVLELGCGAGANIPFFQNLGVEYYAIEGSEAIVRKLWTRFPELKEKIVVADFTKKIPFSNKFDLVIDRSSLTHNSTTDIQIAIDLIEKNLKERGRFIGVDWFSTEHSDRNIGELEVDDFTRVNFLSGQFKNVGQVHFSDKKHLLSLFRNFDILAMQHKIIDEELPEMNKRFASWNFVAQIQEK